VLDQVRERIRYLPFSLRTEEAFFWIRFYIRWSGVRHPGEMGADEVRAFLTYLAAERKVSVSTHRVALPALLFLYQKVLCVDLPWLDGLGAPYGAAPLASCVDGRRSWPDFVITRKNGVRLHFIELKANRFYSCAPPAIYCSKT
jgi:hypothetical protein